MRSLLLFILLAIVLPPAQAQKPQLLFEQANQLYARKRYDSAAQRYQQLIDQGYRNTQLFYNAGNAYYKENRIGPAVYYYEKALQKDPGNKVVQYNLHLARQRVEGNSGTIPALIFVKWEQQIIHLFSPNGWLFGALAFFWLLVLFIALRKLKELRSRGIRWGTYLSALLTILFLIGAFYAFLEINNHHSAIVMAEASSVKAAPDEDSPDLLEIHEGAKVKILDNAPGWDKIRMENGKEGWMPEKSLKAL